MPHNIPNPKLRSNVGSSNPLYPPIPEGATLNAQQGFGNITTLINPFFIQTYYPVSSVIGSFLYFGASVLTTTYVNVYDYNNHAFQTYASGSGTTTITVSSSLDAFNWVGEFSFTGTGQSGSIYRTTGRRYYFMSTFSGSGNATGSLYLISGQ